MARVLEGRTAYASLDFGPIHYEGFLDDGKVIFILYRHEESHPTVEIEVCDDERDLTLESTVPSKPLWKKHIPFDDFLEPNELELVIYEETGLKIIIDPELSWDAFKEIEEINAAYIPEIKNLGHDVANKNRSNKIFNCRKQQRDDYRLKHFGIDTIKFKRER